MKTKSDILKEELIAKGEQLPVYLDYQSTTPLDPRVFDAMKPYFFSEFGNPHSRSHSYGWRAEEAVEIARKQVADLLSADPREIIFTSGATESNNMAVKGVANFYGKKKNHIIVSQIEHKCLLEVSKYISTEGFDITYLPVQKNGVIDLELLKKSITDRTLLVSVMAVNNEIGVVQPIKEIGKICRNAGALFHCDIAQAYGKIPINVEEMNIDLASISAHKIYGPKGIGALYLRRRPRVRISPIMNGGGQERGLRSGTVSPALAAGFGKASEIAMEVMDSEYSHIKTLYNKFLQGIYDRVEHVYLNGDREIRYPGNINLSFACIEGESMILALKDLAISSGSACTSASLEPSYVLRAIGVGDELAHTSLRFGIGRFTTQEHIDFAINLLHEKIEKLRNMSPLWEMMQEGIDISKINWKE